MDDTTIKRGARTGNVPETARRNGRSPRRQVARIAAGAALAPHTASKAPQTPCLTPLAEACVAWLWTHEGRENSVGRLMRWLREVLAPGRAVDGLTWAIRVWCRYSDRPIELREIPEVIDTIPLGGKHLAEILGCPVERGMVERRRIAERAVRRFKKEQMTAAV